MKSVPSWTRLFRTVEEYKGESASNKEQSVGKKTEYIVSKDVFAALMARVGGAIYCCVSIQKVVYRPGSSGGWT